LNKINKKVSEKASKNKKISNNELSKNMNGNNNSISNIINNNNNNNTNSGLILKNTQHEKNPTLSKRLTEIISVKNISKNS
jgi:hypothetical protein